MSITYVVNKAATTFRVSYRATGPDGGGNYTFNTRRGFLRFDLSGAGISGIASAQLILVCTSTVGGGGDILLLSAQDPDGFGTTLDATEADFISSNTYEESTVSVTSTGTKTWTIDPAHISVSGITYFRLSLVGEYGEVPINNGALFNSQNAGTPANRPILRLVLSSGQVILVQVRYA